MLNPVSTDAEATSLGVLTIATGIYLEYWKRQCASLEEFIPKDWPLCVTLFTDRVSEAKNFASTLVRTKINVVPIPALGWPDATLRRYEIFQDNWSQIAGDILMYLDADMLLVREFNWSVEPECWEGGVALVRHPSYYRGDSPWFLRIHEPRILALDAKSMLRGERGLGQWETRRTSRAYVAPRRRKVYVCGGAWFGLRDAIHDLTATLARNTQIDSSHGIVARWHDESHLNAWAASNISTKLAPMYCFDESKPNVLGLSPMIIAVNKSERIR